MIRSLKKLIYIAGISITIFSFGCSHGKKDQSYVGKVYHNTTAHYNGYYYARLKMTETEASVIATRQENFEKLLPVYLTGNPEDNVSGADMDSIVKRLTVVVKLHPKSKWSDDAYFNIGKAYYYKKDYEGAQATFQFVSSEFKDDKKASSSSGSKKKKKTSKSTQDKNVNKYTGTVKEQPQSSGFSMSKHKSVHYEDVLWLARSHAMMKNYGEANAILSYLDTDQKFPSDMKADLQLMHAFVFIQQKQFKNAIEPMQQAVKLTKNKKMVTRYTYILAQLYQLIGDFGTAGKTFAGIADMHPTYEMDFNARIAVVKNYVVSGSGSPSQIVNDLEEMAHNDNFSEFKDQIYYYIGLTQLKQGKEEQAIKNFETSIESSIDNTRQKGLSFLKIGEMNFADEDYLTAAPYYDSAVAFLDAKFDTVDRVKELSRILNEVAKQVMIINSEDSLQRLALMTEKERNKLIDQMVAKIQKAKDDELQEESNVTNVFTEQNNQQSGNQNTSGAKWYFDNAALRSTGFNDFIKKWGTRENADNWRRSNKKSSSGETEDLALGEEDPDGKDGKGNGPASGEDAIRQQLLDNIPLTPEKMEASNNKIFGAYYVLGTIYNSDLHNTPKAIETFEKLATRFESNADIVKVYYNLYLLYRQTGNNSKAEVYRQRILSDSTSMFASVLSDPDYFKKQEAKANEVNVFYASTYDFFVAEQFSDVFQRVMKADSLFKPNPLEAKFDLLHALSVGRTQDRNAYIAALDTVVIKHAAGEEHDKAVEILTLLGAPPKGGAQKQQQEQAKKDEKKDKGPSPYQYKPSNPQYLVVAFSVVDPRTKAISDSLANFNIKNYSLANLKVTPQLLDPKSQMILVKQFKNRDDAMDYYEEITNSETMFEQVESIGYRVFVIDDKSFVTFYQRKNLNEYIEFFEKNYEYQQYEDEEEDIEEEVEPE